MTLRHARHRSWQRSPHRSGRITPAHVLDADPAGRTLCGADPTADDLSNRTARSKAGRRWLTCTECAALIDTDNTNQGAN